MKPGTKAGGLLYLPRKGLVLVERKGSGRDGLVIPKGTPEPGDANLRITAEREVREETGYRATATLFLREVPRPSIDEESPESNKWVNVYWMHDPVLDPSVTPDQVIQIVDPYEAAYGGIMRYPEEAHCVSLHLGTLLRQAAPVLL